MSRRWPMVPLGEVLTERRETPTAEDLLSGRVRIVEKIGFDTGRLQLRADGATKTGMVLVQPGDLLVSGINAAKGAIAIYDETATSPIAATIHYGAYVPDPNRVSVKYLWWLLRSELFRDLLRVHVPGGIKTELRAKRLLRVPVPLPPLEEQRRIVGRIEQLAHRVNEARTLRRETSEAAETLCRAMLWQDPRSQQVTMRELVQPRASDVAVRPDETYQFAGVYCFGRGVFRAAQRAGSEFSYPRLTRLRTGNFVYPKLMAWEGAFGIVPPECDGFVVSTEFPVFEVMTDRVLPEVLDTYFRAPLVWPVISGASTGTNVRRRRLNPQAFLDHKIPLPTRSAQEALRQVRSRLSVLAVLDKDTNVHLDALMSAVLDGMAGEKP